MISLAQYIKSNFMSKNILVTCFNGNEVKGTLEKVSGTFLILKIKNKPLLVRLNNVCYVKEDLE